MARRPTPVRKIRIMISSQCNRQFPAGGRTLTEIRLDIRTRLEAQTLLGQPLFEVWINEASPGRGTDLSSWDACLVEVRKADILLGLNAGHGGWAPRDGEIGICHAELMTAHNASPAKVRVIPIEGSAPMADELRDTNKRFRDYVAQINSFGRTVRTEKELMEEVDKAVVDAVASLVELGVREAKRGSFYAGDALAWSRKPYAERGAAMRDTMRRALIENGGTEHGPDMIEALVGGAGAMFHLHASPASLAVSASRELVGRPFLADHVSVGSYPPDIAGPIHLIACQSGATEAQARAMLGFPDAMIVATPFGIFAADEVQQVQFVLLKECRDDTTVRNGLGRLWAWLTETGEGEAVLARARRRRAVATAIADQVSAAASA